MDLHSFRLDRMSPHPRVVVGYAENFFVEIDLRPCDLEGVIDRGQMRGFDVDVKREDRMVVVAINELDCVLFLPLSLLWFQWLTWLGNLWFLLLREGNLLFKVVLNRNLHVLSRPYAHAIKWARLFVGTPTVSDKAQGCPD